LNFANRGLGKVVNEFDEARPFELGQQGCTMCNEFLLGNRRIIFQTHIGRRNFSRLFVEDTEHGAFGDGIMVETQ